MPALVIVFITVTFIGLVILLAAMRLAQKVEMARFNPEDISGICPEPLGGQPEITSLRNENVRLQKAIALQHETPWWDENKALQERHARDEEEIAKLKKEIDNLLSLRAENSEWDWS